MTTRKQRASRSSHVQACAAQRTTPALKPSTKDTRSISLHRLQVCFRTGPHLYAKHAKHAQHAYLCRSQHRSAPRRSGAIVWVPDSAVAVGSQPRVPREADGDLVGAIRQSGMNPGDQARGDVTGTLQVPLANKHVEHDHSRRDKRYECHCQPAGIVHCCFADCGAEDLAQHVVAAPWSACLSASRSSVVSATLLSSHPFPIVSLHSKWRVQQSCCPLPSCPAATS